MLRAPEEAVQSNQKLVEACRLARADAAAAIARSQALLPTVRHVSRMALYANLSSRRHLVYARVEAVVDGKSVMGVVRTDGGISGHRPLLTRAGLVQGLSETFDEGCIAASIGSDPLSSTLTLTRACDRVLALELVAPMARRQLAPTPDG